MANRYYEAGDGRAARVSELFSVIAPRYDLINDLQSFGLHRLWKRRLIALAEAAPGALALDLCCGTGDLAFELERRGARAVGLDFNAPMLAMARRRLDGHRRMSRASNRPDGPVFTQGDALSIPFRNETFDTVTIGYGLRNLANLESGLREMQRVIKPGGRLLVLDFGKPDNPFWRRVYLGYLGRVVPIFGRVCCGDPQSYAYIVESLNHYPPREGIARRMREAGFDPVDVVNLLGGVMSIHRGTKPAPGKHSFAR